jgi:hypothetical protein
VALTILLSFAVQVLATLDAQLHSSSHLAVMPQTQTEESIGLLTRELRRMEAHPWALRKQNACLSCHTPLRSTLTGPVKVQSQPHYFLSKNLSFSIQKKKLVDFSSQQKLDVKISSRLASTDGIQFGRNS